MYVTQLTNFGNSLLQVENQLRGASDVAFNGLQALNQTVVSVETNADQCQTTSQQALQVTCLKLDVLHVVVYRYVNTWMVYRYVNTWMVYRYVNTWMV